MFGIVLAGGKGKRMKSPLPKVLHRICGKPMIHYIIKELRSLNEIEKIIVVVGYKKDKIIKVLPKDIIIAVQKRMLGTADAIKSCKVHLKNYKKDLLIVCGDTPLINLKTFISLIKKHRNKKSGVTIVTTFVKDPAGYGRILKSSSGKVLGIVEEKDANAKQKKIKEINTGTYCFNWPKLNYALSRIKINRLKGEYYLTDTIAIFKKKGFKIDTYLARNSSEVMGVDDKERLKIAQKYFLRRRKWKTTD